MEPKNYVSQNASNLTRKFQFRSLRGSFVLNENIHLTRDWVLLVTAHVILPQWESFFRSRFLEAPGGISGLREAEESHSGQKAEFRGSNWREWACGPRCEAAVALRGSLSPVMGVGGCWWQGTGRKGEGVAKTVGSEELWECPRGLGSRC